MELTRHWNNRRIECVRLWFERHGLPAYSHLGRHAFAACCVLLLPAVSAIGQTKPSKPSTGFHPPPIKRMAHTQPVISQPELDVADAPIHQPAGVQRAVGLGRVVTFPGPSPLQTEQRKTTETLEGDNSLLHQPRLRPTQLKYASPNSSSTSAGLSIADVQNQIASVSIHDDLVPVKISLGQLMGLALSHSKNVQVLRILPAEQKQQVNQQFGRFDWTAFVETVFAQDAQPVGNLNQTNRNIQQVRNDRNEVGIGIRKSTYAGGSLELRETLATADSNSGFLNPEEPGSAQLGITFSQEFMRGGGQDIVLSQALVADINAQAVHADAFAQTSDLLHSILIQYWVLYQTRGDYFIQSALINWAEETLALLESRGRIDAERNSIEQARALLLEAKANLENARAAVRIAQDELYRLINAPEIDSNRFEVITGHQPQAIVREFSVAEELGVALQRRSEVAQRLLEIQGAAVEHHVSLNQLLPRLTLSLESSLNGIDENRDVFGAVANTLDVDPTYSAGVSFEFFLGNRTAKAQNRQAQLALQRLQLQYEDQIEEIRLDVARAIRTLNASTKILQQRSETLLARNNETEYLRLRRDVIPKEGVSPTFLLEQYFQAINRLTVSQQAYVAAVRDQQAALADLLRAKGLLLDASQIPQNLKVPVPYPYAARKLRNQQRASFVRETERRVVLPGLTERLR